MVIEYKVIAVIEFASVIGFVVVIEFIEFTECILFMRDAVIDGERRGGTGAGGLTLLHTQCHCQAANEFSNSNILISNMPFTDSPITRFTISIAAGRTSSSAIVWGSMHYAILIATL